LCVRSAGDRIRGIKFTMKLAYASNRVLLVDDKKPVPLETSLLPNLVNWATEGILVNESSFARLILIAEDKTADSKIDFSAFYGDAQFVVLHTNYAGDVAIPDPPRPIVENVAGDFLLNTGTAPVPREDLLRASCLLQALFKPHADLQRDYEAAMQQLFGAPSAAYVAIHFRAGGMKDSEKYVVKRADDNLSALMRSLACARGKAKLRNVTAPMLLLTDNHDLRQAIRRGLLGADVVTTNFKAVHIDFVDPSRPSDTTLQRVIRTVYVDLLLLTGAECLVVPTRSGFSNEAHLWAAHACYINWVHECFAVPLDQAMKSRMDLPLSW
jgi:hypothetical protein